MMILRMHDRVCVRISKYCARPLAALLLVGLMAFVSACGARQPATETLPWTHAAVTAPADREALLAHADAVHTEASDALVAAFTQLVLADYDAALRVLIDDRSDWSAPSLRVARLVFFAWNLANFIDLEPLRAWLDAQDLDALTPPEWALRDVLHGYLANDLHEALDLDTLPSALEAGAAESWTFYGPVAATTGYQIDQQGIAGEVASLAELPLDGVAKRRVIPTAVGMLLDLPSPGQNAFLESFLVVDEESEVVFSTLGVGEVFTLWVGEEEVLRRHVEDANASGYSMATVRLQPGAYRVLVRYGQKRTGNRAIHARAIRGAIRRFDASAGPATATSVERVSAHPRTLSAWLRPPDDDDLAGWLATATLAVLDDEAAAFALAHDVVPQEHPARAWMRANLFESLANYPLRQSQSLDTLRAIDARWGALPGVEMMTAQLAFTASDDDDAPLALAPYASDPEASPHLRRAYASMVGQLGFDALAARTLTQLVEEYPTWCPVVNEYIQRAAAYRRVLPDETYAALPDRCERLRTMRLTQLEMRRGESEAYLAHAARRMARAPGHTRERFHYLWELLNLSSADTAQRFLDTLDPGVLSDEEQAAAEAAIAYRQEGARAARASLEAAFEAHPSRERFYTGAARLGAADQLADLRIDGLQALEAYRARETTAAGENRDVVYVLDYGAWRFLDGGGVVNLTHQIIALNSREAVREFGEISEPERGVTLEMRVIKPDGTIRSPVRSADKSALSLPDLDVGDVIELENIVFHPPSPRESAGYTTGGFYFALSGVQLAHSQLVVEYPSAWPETALTLETFNLPVEVETSTKDSYVRKSIVVKDSQALRYEPGTPELSEFGPWAIAHVAPNRDMEIARYAEFLGTQIAPSPEIEALTATILGDQRGARSRAQTLFNYVVDDVEMGGGFFAQSALETARMHRGSRIALLFAMLESAGLDPQVAFVRSFDTSVVRSEVFDIESFDSTAIFVEAGGTQYWMDPERQFAAFDMLPSYVQGGDAIVVAGSRVGETLVVPEWPGLGSVNAAEAELWLEPNGDARIRYVFRYSDEEATQMRAALEYSRNENERIRYMEQYLSVNYGPATLDSLEIEAEDEPEKPLVMRMEGRVEGIARVEGGALIIDASFEPPAQLAAYTALPTRQQPLLMSSPVYTDFELTIHPPKGFELQGGLEGAELRHGEHSYTRERTRDGKTTVGWRREVRVHRGRVAVADYPALADFAKRVEEVERVRLRWIAED